MSYLLCILLYSISFSVYIATIMSGRFPDLVSLRRHPIQCDVIKTTNRINGTDDIKVHMQALTVFSIELSYIMYHKLRYRNCR